MRMLMLMNFKMVGARAARGDWMRPNPGASPSCFNSLRGSSSKSFRSLSNSPSRQCSPLRTWFLLRSFAQEVYGLWFRVWGIQSLGVQDASLVVDYSSV